MIQIAEREARCLVNYSDDAPAEKVVVATNVFCFCEACGRTELLITRSLSRVRLVKNTSEFLLTLRRNHAKKVWKLKEQQCRIPIIT